MIGSAVREANKVSPIGAVAGFPNVFYKLKEIQKETLATSRLFSLNQLLGLQQNYSVLGEIFKGTKCSYVSSVKKPLTAQETHFTDSTTGWDRVTFSGIYRVGENTY